MVGPPDNIDVTNPVDELEQLSCAIAQLHGPTERAVAAAWTRTLPGEPQVGPQSNFFELGGSSLRAVRMLAILHDTLDERHGGGTDAFKRGNQRFATRLCGLYRKPRLRDFCVWLEWAALPAPDASSPDSADTALAAFAVRHGVARTDSIGGTLRSHALASSTDGTSPAHPLPLEASTNALTNTLPQPGCATAGDLVSSSAPVSSSALLAAADVALPDSLALIAYATEALCRAAHAGGRALVSELLASSAQVDGSVNRRDRRLTPLMLAARRGGVEEGANPAEITATLLAAGASVNLVSRTQASAAHYAARAGSMAVLSILVRAEGFAVRARDLNKWSALFHAAHGGSAECVQLLIDCSAAVVAADRWGRTPLCWACAGGHTRAATVLLEAGASPNGVGKRPQAAHLERYCQYAWSTPLHLALRTLHRAKAAGEPPPSNDDGQDMAAVVGTRCKSFGGQHRSSDLELMQLLLSSHANASIRDQGGHTPLEEAKRLGCMAAIDLLCKDRVIALGTQAVFVPPSADNATPGRSLYQSRKVATPATPTQPPSVNTVCSHWVWPPRAPPFESLKGHSSSSSRP